jgi:REP element-mobilizing transposase RayT
MHEREFPDGCGMSRRAGFPMLRSFTSASEQIRINLTEPQTARRLLESAAFYTDRGRWWAWLFLVMPDHLHTLLSFPRAERMSAVMVTGSAITLARTGSLWQEGYFDHRLRQEESFAEKAAYIRANPVVKGCVSRQKIGRGCIPPIATRPLRKRTSCLRTLCSLLVERDLRAR